MQLLRQHQLFTVPTHMLKTIMLSIAVVSTVAITGCASKPQINNSARYAVAPNFYTVRSGDTLSSIAARYGLSYISIAEMNDIAPPYRIYVNQSLRLKDSGNRRSTTQAITQAAPIQRQSVSIPTAPVTTTPSVTSQAPTASVDTSRASKLRWVKPSNGAILQNFNLANNVKGTRYTGTQGDPIYAAADGQVVYAADGLKEYGNLVLIKHIDGYITAYAHNSKMNVKSGENVRAGQKIAEMGSSGTNRVMLEFQVRLDGKPINPSSVLPTN